jgi:hypothetical protein
VLAILLDNVDLEAIVFNIGSDIKTVSFGEML